MVVKPVSLYTKAEISWKPPSHGQEVSAYSVTAAFKKGAEAWTGVTEPGATHVLIDGLDPAVVKAGGYSFAVTAVDHTGGQAIVLG